MKNFCLLFCLIVGTTAHAQYWVGLGAGGNQNMIKYLDDEGVRDKGIQGVPSVYVSAFVQRALGSPKAYYQAAYINAIVTEWGYKRGVVKNNNSSELDRTTLDNLSTTITFRHMRHSKSLVNLYFGGGVFADYLISGVQERGFEQFDLTEDFKKLNFGLVADAGITYWMSHEVYGTLGLSYAKGLRNLEKGDQTLHINNIKIGIAVFFQLKN